MNHSFRLEWLSLALLAGIVGVGVSLASVASAQEGPSATAEVVEATEADGAGVAAEDAAGANAGAGNPGGWNDGDATAALSYEASNDYTINTLIMFVCAVLVLFMQAGFAMVEVGLNSAKNTVNILAKNVMDLSVGVLLFLFIGYGLMYPGEWIAEGFLGVPSSFVERDAQVGELDGAEIWAAAPTYDDGAYASNSADFLFQVAFAATAATIVSGAVAGRMKFQSYLIYSAILTGIIYPISGAWMWGGGFLDAMGFQDFAGSVVVHAVGGFAGLAGAMFLGPRLGRYTSDGKSVPIPGHNIAFAALGVFVLWVGWYGFNPGSQLTYSGAVNAEATTYIALTTTISAAAGAVFAMITAWGLFGKPDLTMALNGALGGLVSITANCDRVTQVESLVIGAIGGALVVTGIVLLDKFRIDDPVGAWPVHGLCGVWGGIATGIFGDLPDGIETVAGFVAVQSIATVVICVWAFISMSVVFGALKAVGMLRVSAEEEQAGLDISEHGMHAYPSDAVAGGAIA